ncbi:MAG: hypothetical protein AAF533_08780 [Acidobacteriota bacterium]
MFRILSKRQAAVPCLGVAAWALTAITVAACGSPPVPPNDAVLACDVMISPTVVTPGGTVEVTMTVTNYGDPFDDPPYRVDDRFIIMGSRVLLDRPPSESDICNPWGSTSTVRRALSLHSGYWEATLDDAYSPDADDPVTWSETFSVEIPEDVDDRSILEVGLEVHSVRGGYPFNCYAMECLQVEEEPSEVPHATFVDPVGMGASGASVPFVIEVERNGWAPERPLRLVVRRENTRDALDLFPIEPAELAEEGLVITGESARVEMTCGLHFPCFVGMANRLHLELLDGDDVVWESRVGHPDGSGEACVADTTLAHLELLSVDGGSPTRALSPYRDHEIVVRGLLRNPAVGARMEEPSLSFSLPPGVEVLDHRLYHHDNPLDDVTPSEDALAIQGAMLVVEPSGRAVATAPWLEHRFVETTEAPPVFVDLFEVELRLHVPSELLVTSGRELVLPGVEARAVLGDRVRERVTDALRLPIDAGIDLEPPRLELPGAPRSPRIQPGLLRRSDRR